MREQGAHIRRSEITTFFLFKLEMNQTNLLIDVFEFPAYNFAGIVFRIHVRILCPIVISTIAITAGLSLQISYKNFNSFFKKKKR